MRTLSPSAGFLRVADKFFPAFILADPEIKTGATLLYLYLSHLCRQRDHCWPSQETLARACKCSVKSVQNHLQQLVAAQYIRIEKQDGHSIYTLLLSPRVERMLALTGTDMVPERTVVVSEAGSSHSADSSGCEKNSYGDTKNLRAGGENFSPYRRVLGDQEKLPPPPQPVAARPAVPHSPRSERRVRSASLGTQTAVEFDQLFAVWPMRKDKLVASRIFDSLARTGKLPELATLLATVARMKALDKHWKNGCVPALSTWLRGERWLDEPYQPEVSSQPQSLSVPADPEIQQRVRALHEKFGSNLFSDAPPISTATPVPVTPLLPATTPHVQEMSATAVALCSLWPDSSRQTVMLGLFRERQKGTNLSSLVAQAQSYIRSATMPIPVLEWLNVREDECTI